MLNNDSCNSKNFTHLPVLAKEVLAAMSYLSQELKREGLMIDATLGGGGHSALVLNAHPALKIIGIDHDPTARKAATYRLESYGSRIQIIDENFANFSPEEKAVFVLADLGVSSPQLDEPKRGFSFKKNGPLDMRMNPSQGITAAELIQNLNEKQLADIIYQYGEERFSRRIARKIKYDLKEKGAYQDTRELANAITSCFPRKANKSRIHPATRTFQALRIAVNNELKNLDLLLDNAPNWLKPDGILCIISFHSLEDRKVKNAFRNNSLLERVTKKPLIASEQEKAKNPRSRSAKLRIARRKISSSQ